MATTAWDPTKSYLPGETAASGGIDWVAVKKNKAIKPGGRPGTWAIYKAPAAAAPAPAVPKESKIAAFDGKGGFRIAQPSEFPASNFNGNANDIVALFGNSNLDSSHCLAADGSIQPIGGGGGGAVDSVNGHVGVVVLTASDLSLAAVASSGAYSDLSGRPSLAAIATSGSASDLSTGTVPIARIPLGSTGSTVCVGNDSRLSNARTPTAHHTSHEHGGSDVITVSVADITGLAAVATSGAYSDLSGTPTIPGGTVTSVALTAPSELSVGGTPVTGSGTLALTWASQPDQNFVFATPDGATGVPGFRALTPGDIPALSYVASITLTAPAEFNVTNPLGSAGNVDFAWANEAAHTVLAGPNSGSPGVPGFRALVVGDIPSGYPYSSLSGTPSTFAPSAHASSHAAAGSDPVTITEAQVTNLVSDLSSLASSLALKANTSSIAAIGFSGSATDLVTGTVPIARIPTGSTGSTVPFGNDARFSDARTPTAHAASHASGGGDPVTLAESQVTNLVTDLAAKAPLASPALTGTPTAPTAAPGTSSMQLATTAFVGAALPARGTHTVATVSLAPNVSDSSQNIALGGKTALLLQLQTDFAAWVVLYATAAARTADAGRAQNVDATPGSGVLAEFITSAGGLIINTSPIPVLSSEESSPQTYIPIRVTNLALTTQVTNVTIKTIPIEA